MQWLEERPKNQEKYRPEKGGDYSLIVQGKKTTSTGEEK